MVATSVLVASAIAAGATAGSSIYAANKQSGAAKEAAKTQSDAATTSAKLQTDAANHAADMQAQSAHEALDYSRAQSQLSLDQYNQQQQRLQPYRNLGNFALGQPMEGPQTPLQLAALPGQSGQQPPSAQQSAAQGPAVSAQNGDIASQVADYFKARGVTPNPTSVDYWSQKWNEFGAKDPAYFNQRLAIADEFAGSTGGAAPAAVGPRQPVTLGFRAGATPLATKAPLTAALQAPSLRYRPLGSIGEM